MRLPFICKIPHAMNSGPVSIALHYRGELATVDLLHPH